MLYTLHQVYPPGTPYDEPGMERTQDYHPIACPHGGLLLKDDNGHRRFEVIGEQCHTNTSTTGITINGRPASLDDLQPGDRIEVSGRPVVQVKASRP